MQLYLATAPDRLDQARPYTSHLAHAAYRIGPDAHLTARPLPQQLRGGLMMLSDLDAPLIRQPEPLCREVVRECIYRNYSGVVLDFDSAPSADRIRLVRRLDEVLRRQNKTLFLPEAWGTYTEYAAILICTALSGGTLRARLEEAQSRFAPRPIALDCQRLAMDFLLPSPNGEGAPLTRQQLQQLQQGRPVYFSEDLCARYFTYRTRQHTHFVLFDDADTIRRKLRLAEELGITTAFVMLPEVDDLLEGLFDRKK